MPTHHGAGLVLLCADPRSNSYGKILCVLEKHGRNAGKYSPPGGYTDPNDRDFIHTAFRETAEETAHGDSDSDAIRRMIEQLYCFVTVDKMLTKSIQLRSGLFTGCVYGVISHNCLFPEDTAHLEKNSECGAYSWLSVDEIRNLYFEGRFRGSLYHIDLGAHSLAARHYIHLA